MKSSPNERTEGRVPVVQVSRIFGKHIHLKTVPPSERQLRRDRWYSGNLHSGSVSE